MNRPPHSRARLIAGIAIVAAIDLVTKLWASRALADGGIDLPGPVDLRRANNQGVAFGALGDLPAPITIIATAAIVIVLVLAGLRGAVPVLPCALIAGGALGNVIDRIHGGSVVDLLHTGWWPTFNLADVFITVGAGLLVAGLARTPQLGDHDDATTPVPTFGRSAEHDDE